MKSREEFSDGQKLASSNLSESISEFYDQRWMEKEYKNTERARIYEKRRVQLILNCIKKGNKQKILEIGCGEGNVISKLNLMNNIVFGLDPSRVAILTAKQRIKRCLLIQALGENIPIKNKSFDVVLFPNVIEHLHSPEGVLKEIYRILKDDGELVISTPNFLQLGNRSAIFFGKKPSKTDEVEHIHEFYPKELKMLLRKMGFKIRKVRGLFLPTPSWTLTKFIMKHMVLYNFFVKLGYFLPSIAKQFVICAKKRAMT